MPREDPEPLKPIAVRQTITARWLNALLNLCLQNRVIPDPSSGLVGRRTPAGTVLSLALTSVVGLAWGTIGGTAIAAKSGSTISSGSVTLKTFTFSGSTATQASGQTVTAYNFWPTAATANKDCLLVKLAGVYWIVTWAC